MRLRPRGAADADGGGDGFGVIHRVSQHQRGRTGGLHPQNARQAALLGGVVLGEAHPVSRDVARVAHRQAQPVGGGAQGFNDLKRGRLLAFQAVRVKRIDQGHGVAAADFHHQRQGVIERAGNLNDLGPIGRGPRQLARGHLAFGDDHNGAHAGP